MRAAALPLLAILLASGVSAQEPAAETAPHPTGEIAGSVADPSGSPLAHALVTLEADAPGERRTTVTEEAGTFRFSAVPTRAYKVTIVAAGFAPWSALGVTVSEGAPASISARLELAPVATTVNVGVTKEMAAEELKTEEKQRLIHVFPNYFVTYDPDAPPLTAGQKFQLGWKWVIDPVNIFVAGATAGIEQARDSYYQFGQGVEGYARRFGSLFADNVNGTIIGGVMMQAVFHQDPRYFYKGTGSIGSRLLYAIKTAFLRKGDDGRWQANYSDALGAAASTEISRFYDPESSRMGLRIFHNLLATYGGDIGGNLAEEFILRKFTTHSSRQPVAAARPILNAGTQVTLISVEPLDRRTAEDSGAIGFVLLEDVTEAGAVTVRAGSKASGQVSFAAGSGPGGEDLRIKLEHVTLESGQTQIPLRSTAVRGGNAPLQFHRLDDSGRISVVLYVDENTALDATQ